MGWCNESYPEHEGWLIGWAPAAAKGKRGALADSTLKEITCPPGLGPVGSVEIEVWAVQIGCCCGWRSPLLRAPLGTCWSPHCVHLPPNDRESDESERREQYAREHGAPWGRSFEKECRLAWREQHLASLMPGEFFSRKLMKF